jgi:hypothetical protein
MPWKKKTDIQMATKDEGLGAIKKIINHDYLKMYTYNFW